MLSDAVPAGRWEKDGQMRFGYRQGWLEVVYYLHVRSIEGALKILVHSVWAKSSKEQEFIRLTTPQGGYLPFSGEKGVRRG